VSFYYQSGEGFNLLQRAASVKALTTSGTIDANYPLANLYSGRPSQYAKWTPAANINVVADLNLVPNGDGESATIPAGWVATVGSIVQTTSTPYSGSGSLRVYNATAPTAYCDVRMRAGEKFRVYYAAKSTTGTVSVKLTDLDTGLDLSTGAAWAAGQTLVSTASTSWTSGYVTATIPTAEAGGALWQRCRVTLAVTGAAGDGAFEVKIIPGWDTVVLLGHTCGVSVPLGLDYQALSSNDPGDSFSSASYVSDWLKTVSTNSDPIPVAEYCQPAAWNKATATRYERWVRPYITRTDYNPTTAVGELILCQAETLPRGASLNVTDTHEAQGQIRYETGAGDLWAYNRTPYPRRKILLRYQTADSPAMPGPSPDEATIRRFFIERTHGGRWPILVIPYGTHDSSTVIYGHATNVMTIEHMPPLRSLEVEVVGLPIPGLAPGLSQTDAL
jgi:hypothetical protein